MKKKQLKRKLSERIVTILASGLLIINSLTTTVNAQTITITENDTVILQTIESRLKDILLVHYDDNLSNSDKFSYGNAIPCYNYVNGEYAEINNMKLYPIYRNGIVIGTLKETFADSESQFSYSEEYAAEINEHISTENSAFNFVFEDDNLFICSNGEAEFVNSYTPTTCKSVASFNVKTTEVLKVYSETSRDTFSINADARADVITKYLSVAPWNQGQTGLCWAGTVEAIGEFVTNNYSYTPWTIADAMGIGYNEGSSIGDSRDALSQLYGLNASVMGGVPYYTVIVNEINSNQPMYMGLQASTKGHAVTLIGYGATSSKYYIRIMDTYGGSYKTLEYNNGAQLSIGSNVYNWNNTIRIN